jgi:hypothetical protein
VGSGHSPTDRAQYAPHDGVGVGAVPGSPLALVSASGAGAGSPMSVGDTLLGRSPTGHRAATLPPLQAAAGSAGEADVPETVARTAGAGTRHAGFGASAAGPVNDPDFFVPEAPMPKETQALVRNLLFRRPTTNLRMIKRNVVVAVAEEEKTSDLLHDILQDLADDNDDNDDGDGGWYEDAYGSAAGPHGYSSSSRYSSPKASSPSRRLLSPEERAEEQAARLVRSVLSRGTINPMLLTADRPATSPARSTRSYVEHQF